MTRKLDIGDVLSRVFTIYGDQAGVLLPVAAILFLGEAVLGQLLIDIEPGLVVVALLVQIVASVVYAGMVVELVSDVQDGRRDHSVGSLFEAVAGVLFPLMVASLLVGALVVLGLVLFIVPGLALMTMFAVVPAAVVVERRGALGALKRSWELVRGNGVQVFGVIVVVFLLTIVVNLVVGLFGAAAGAVGAIVASIVASTLTAPISALAVGVLYLCLREVRGEGDAGFAAAGPEAVTPR